MATARESGRLNSPEEERKSVQGRWREMKVERLWNDREMAAEKEMGMGVYTESVGLRGDCILR